MRKVFALILAMIFVLIPLTSCAKEEKKPPKEESTTVTEEKEETVSEGEKSFGDQLRDSIEVDPLYSEDHPGDDEELNVLLIGNSYSTHWPDELVKLLTAAGYENVMVCAIYHSGATFEDHWNWMQNRENVEDFHIHRSGKEEKIWSSVGFEECVTYANWDYISFQQSNRYVGNTEKHRASIAEWLPKLYSYVYAYFPQATYFWQQNWSHSAGKDSYSTTETTERYLKWHREQALFICEEWGFINAPLGQAWTDIRYDPLFYSHSGDYKNDNPTKSLHTRIYESSSLKGTITNSDLSHDGNIGGGQYLNACVWFEMLTHKSVVGNSFVPEYYHEESGKTYTFTAEQIAKLQNAAHQAVLGDYGEEWYQ